MNMAASKLSQEERLRRKREAAKLRQRRCRAKKKREAELQKIRKSKSKSIVSPYKKPDSVQFMNLSNQSAFKPVTQMDFSGGTDTCPELTKDLLALTPCSSSSSPSTVNLVTPQGSSALPPMPPLSSSTRFEEERVSSTSTPPTQIDEHELTAIDAILSLRRSPVTEPEEKINPSSPESFHCEVKSTQAFGGSLDYVHDHNVPLPFLPEIKSPVSAKLPFPVGCKSVASRSISYYPYKTYGISRYPINRIERGDLLMQNRCSLAPGVYFYYNGV